MTPKKKIDLKALKKALLERSRMLAQQTEATEEDRKPVELDQALVGRLSRMDALQVQAMAIETDRRREVEMERITSALKRMEDGEFGFCVSCGDEIPAKRLAFDPATPQCVDCAGAG